MYIFNVYMENFVRSECSEFLQSHPTKKLDLSRSIIHRGKARNSISMF